MKNQVREKIHLLCKILDQISDLYKDYLKMLANEKRLLVSHSLERYQELVEKKEILSNELLILEQRRKDTLKEISSLLGNVQGRLDSQKILRLLDGEEKQILQVKLEGLKSLVLEIKYQNDQLEFLLGKMVHFISNLFARLKGCLRAQEFYTPGATKQILEMPGLLISEMA